MNDLIVYGIGLIYIYIYIYLKCVIPGYSGARHWFYYGRGEFGPCREIDTEHNHQTAQRQDSRLDMFPR